jgi:hypothetical protein
MNAFTVLGENSFRSSVVKSQYSLEGFIIVRMLVTRIWLHADDLCYRPGGPPLLALKSSAPAGKKATATTTFPSESSDGPGGKSGQ